MNPRSRLDLPTGVTLVAVLLVAAAFAADAPGVLTGLALAALFAALVARVLLARRGT